MYRTIQNFNNTNKNLCHRTCCWATTNFSCPKTNFNRIPLILLFPFHFEFEISLSHFAFSIRMLYALYPKRREMKIVYWWYTCPGSVYPFGLLGSDRLWDTPSFLPDGDPLVFSHEQIYCSVQSTLYVHLYQTAGKPCGRLGCAVATIATCSL